MNLDLVNLKGELTHQFRCVLIEIDSVANDLLDWTERFPRSEFSGANQRKLIAMKRIRSTVYTLLHLQAEFRKELHPVILPITLSEMIFDIRSPISVIHSYVELFKLAGFEMLTAEEVEAMHNISRCEQILLKLAKKLEYYDQVVEQQERTRGAM